MKYGLLYYKDTDNIGDDIQTYAASRFLPKIDYMIDRENLNAFIPKKKEYVKTIMNAWYIHDKINFDISPYINPLFVSMFFKYMPYEDGTVFGIDYINNNVISMLKKYSPVGARDKHTEKIMEKFNVPTYFSGCMTLTIKPFENIKKGGYIVVVGLSKEEISYIKKSTKRKVIEFIQDVPKCSFSNETWNQRKKRVEEALKLYQGAHMVITTKLHCSLPTLALGTPILLLYDKSKKENQDRIGSYLPYLNHMDRTEFLNSSYNFEKPKKNPNKHIELREKLIQRCENFIKDQSTLDVKELLDPKDYKYYLDRSNEQKRVLIDKFQKLSYKYKEECAKSNQMYLGINAERTEFENQKNELKENIESLNKTIIDQKEFYTDELKKLDDENKQLIIEKNNITNEKNILESNFNYVKSTIRFKIIFNKKRFIIFAGIMFTLFVAFITILIILIK